MSSLSALAVKDKFRVVTPNSLPSKSVDTDLIYGVVYKYDSEFNGSSCSLKRVASKF
jgi:hypothetical protein